MSGSGIRGQKRPLRVAAIIIFMAKLKASWYTVSDNHDKFLLVLSHNVKLPLKQWPRNVSIHLHLTICFQRLMHTNFCNEQQISRTLHGITKASMSGPLNNERAAVTVIILHFVVR